MNFNLEQDKRYVMGILNVTPDSFFDGGKYATLDKVMVRVDEMIAEGVDIIDIGGESSRPGSDRISIQEELDRILPVVSKIRDNYDIPISIDSMKSDVVEELLPFKIDIINDISSLSDNNFINILKKTDAYICLMHMIEDPSTMQNDPSYRNVTEEVFKYLEEKSTYCSENGISPKKIIIDPGFGFGKTLDHNYELLKNLDKFIEINPGAGLDNYDSFNTDLISNIQLYIVQETFSDYHGEEPIDPTKPMRVIDITEKTFKGFIYGLPMFLNARQDSCKTIEQLLGFDMLQDYNKFDYDSEPRTTQRIDQMLESARDFPAINNDIVDRLKQNKNRAVSKQHLWLLQKDFMDLMLDRKD